MPIDGMWDLTISTPMGAQGGTLRLIVQDQHLAGELGSRDGKLTIRDGEVIGSDLFWTIDATTGPIEFSASVVEDTMTGEIQLGDFGDITFTGTYIGLHPDA